MDNSKSKSGNRQTSNKDGQSHIKESASELINEGKKFANELYEEGADKVNEKVSELEECIQDYSDKLIRKIQKNPLGSVLISVGVGMLLSSFFKK